MIRYEIQKIEKLETFYSYKIYFFNPRQRPNVQSVEADLLKTLVGFAFGFL